MDSPKHSLRATSRDARTALGALALLAATASAGCYTNDQLRDRADRDALALIEARRAQLFEDAGPFALPAATRSYGRTLEDPNALLTLREEVLAGTVGLIGPINVVDALAIAAENSIQFQQQQERLYLAALDLTQDRWFFGNRYNADGAGLIAGDVGGAAASASVGSDATLTRILGSGATIIGNIGSSLFRFVSTGDGWDAVSNIGLSITQPLLRGSGRLVTLEPLRQSERNLIYAVRDYERFRREFAVRIAGQVYRTLQTNDQLKNQKENVDNAVTLLQRNLAFAEAGRQSKVQVDQAEQQKLNSETGRVNALGRFQNALDAFKVELGLPVSVDLEFEEGILEALGSDDASVGDLLIARLSEVGGDDIAVDFAIDHRLDVITAFDQVQDATRREAIARDALRAGLGVTVAGDSFSDDGRPLGHSIDDATFQAALDVDLPVDLLPLRNAWRRAEIAVVNERRLYERFLDGIAVDVRQQLRDARNALESLKIQLNSAKLANERVEQTLLTLDLGLATTRDVVDSQRDLLDARNNVTSARITYTTSLLDLMLGLEILRVDETGIHPDPALLDELLAR